MKAQEVVAAVEGITSQGASVKEACDRLSINAANYYAARKRLTGKKGSKPAKAPVAASKRRQTSEPRKSNTPSGQLPDKHAFMIVGDAATISAILSKSFGAK